MRDRDVVKMGVIGVGAIGKVHCEVIQQWKNPHLVLAATADRSPATEYPGVFHYADYREMLTDPKIDAVSICTPPDTHYSLTIEALGAGKDVLVEKPPALSVEQLDDMEAKALKSGLVLFTAYHAVYSPDVNRAAEMMRGQRIDGIEVIYNEDHSKDDPKKWLFDPRKSGGGAVMDSGINAVSVVRSIVPGDAPVSVARSLLAFADRYVVETAAEVSFLVGDIQGHLSMNWLSPEERHSIIFRTNQGEYTIDKTKGQVRVDGEIVFGGEASGREATDQHVEYQGVYRDLVGSVRRRSSFVLKEELRFVRDTYRKAGIVYARP